MATRDENRIPTWYAVSYLDGTTLVPIVINSATGGMKKDTTHTIGFTPNSTALRDEDRTKVVMGVSSADPTVLIPLYANPSTGGVLMDN